MLVEIHVIQNHAPSNLNRDDTGSPKSCNFGGIPRSRISSQCLKRTIRQSEFFQQLLKTVGISYRTRKLPELVKNLLIKKGISEEKATQVGQEIISIGKSTKKKKKSTEGDEKESQDNLELITSQIMFFSDAELNAIVDEIMSNLDKKTNNFVDTKKLRVAMSKKELYPVTPDIALFGRMITSDAFMNIEAAAQVAHAISTNKFDREFDYFTAVDDLATREQGAVGAGMIGDVEFNSACYYKYFSVDSNAFLENIKGANEIDQGLKETLSKTIEAFLSALIFVTPSGKQNTFAAHQLPDGILVEVRPSNIPVSYANAFVEPCYPSRSQDLIQASLEKFKQHTELITKKFSLKSQARLWFTTREIEIDGATTVETIDDLIASLLNTLNG